MDIFGIEVSKVVDLMGVVDRDIKMTRTGCDLVGSDDFCSSCAVKKKSHFRSKNGMYG